MPTPVHEDIPDYAMANIFDAIAIHTGMSTRDTTKAIHLRTDSEIDTGEDGSGGRKIPDISIQVRLHPPQPRIFFTGIVWEIGVSQSLASLKQRARMFLSHRGMAKDVNIHLVVLVYVDEEEGPKEYLGENGEVIMIRQRAKSIKWDWPKQWFENRGVVEEVNRLGGMKKSVKDELKQEISSRLLEQDQLGLLMPSLMELLGAHLITYHRSESFQQVTSAAGVDNQPDENEATGQHENVPEEQSSDNEQGSEGYPRDSEGAQGSTT